MYVSGSQKTGLIYTKYTYSYYGTYLFSMYVIQILLVLLNSLEFYAYIKKFVLKCCVTKMRYYILMIKI